MDIYIVYDKVINNNGGVKENSNNEDNLSESNNSLSNDNSINKEKPYLEGQIKEYYYDEDCGGNQEATYNFELATDKISNFYIGGTIYEYADMVVQVEKLILIHICIKRRII